MTMITIAYIFSFSTSWLNNSKAETKLKGHTNSSKVNSIRANPPGGIKFCIHSYQVMEKKGCSVLLLTTSPTRKIPTYSHYNPVGLTKILSYAVCSSTEIIFMLCVENKEIKWVRLHLPYQTQSSASTRTSFTSDQTRP